MNILQIARTIDFFALAFVFGATAWFFFVQSPVLLKKLGREQFVPIQMRLTVVLFRTLIVFLFIMFGASSVHSLLDSSQLLLLVQGQLLDLLTIFSSFLMRSGLEGKVVQTSKGKIVRDQSLALHRRVQEIKPNGSTGQQYYSWSLCSAVQLCTASNF